MSNTIDEIFFRYWNAVEETAVADGLLPSVAVRLCLRLAVQDAYGAGAALCNDMAAIIASQQIAILDRDKEIGSLIQVLPPQTPDQRQAEADRAQMALIAEWLAEHEPALYYGEHGGYGDAILDAVRKRDAQIDGLQQEIARMDADNADLAAKLQNATLAWKSAQSDADRLALRIAQQPAEIHVNGNGAVDPTPAPNWNRNHWAWDGLPKADFDVIDQLEAGALSFRKLDKTLRRDLVLRVVRSLAVDGELKVAVYDSRKPAWMPTNGAVTMFSPNGRWFGLVAEALGKAEPTPA